MATFHICDEVEYGRGHFCVYADRAFERLANRGAGISHPRCIKHGRLLSHTVWADTREKARKLADPDVGVPETFRPGFPY
jgi:hypothetical protein